MSDGDDAVEVTGLEAQMIGGLLASHGVALRELTPHRATLEDAYLRLTAGAGDHTSGQSDDHTRDQTSGHASGVAPDHAQEGL